MKKFEKTIQLKWTKSLVALSLVLALAGLLSAASQKAATLSTAPTGGVPTLSVTAVTLNPAGVTCGTEIDCARVTWDAKVPLGTTITGFTIVLKVTRSDGTFENNTKTAVGTARQIDMPAAFHSVTVVSYVASVTANYSSTLNTNKSATL